MKIYDRQTNNEIPSKTKASGSDHVRNQLIQHGYVKDITFGSSSRGTITDIAFSSETIFENCKFNYIDFSALNNCTFINCEFYKSRIDRSSNLKFDNCFDSSKGLILFDITESLEFYNCPNLHICACDYFPHGLPNVVTDGSCESAERYLNTVKKFKEKEEEYRKLSEQLRAEVPYGYKVVRADVLVKLSFPEDALLVNLDKMKSRASKAFVESVRIINDFEGEGVTNHSYAPLNYKVGEIVEPDGFDANPYQDCGKGIHFCRDILDLPYYTGISCERAKYLKSIENQL